METKHTMTEQLLEAAACEALGTNSPEESAAYQQELARSGDAARKTDRDLRQAVAMLSAASPYLEPPGDLRGKILQTTAPQTFRMEDYRKATRENSKFYKWGFYAAACFLMAAAWFNMAARDNLKRANDQLSSLTARANDEINQRNKALAAFANPNSQIVTYTYQGKPVWRAVIDEKSRQAVVMLPTELVPPGFSPQLTIHNKETGEDIAYNTVLMTGPAQELKLSVPQDANVAMLFNVRSTATDEQHRPVIAGSGPNP